MMDADHDDYGGRVPLAGLGKSYSAERPAAHRYGIRHARRVSNWTAAALIVGTGAAAVAFAHQAVPAAAPATGTAAPGAGAPAAGAGASTPGTTAPQVSHSVATTSASGVTTTTRTVNGKTVVTRTAPARGDD
jgi:hypothetical protein